MPLLAAAAARVRSRSIGFKTPVSADNRVHQLQALYLSQADDMVPSEFIVVQGNRTFSRGTIFKADLDTLVALGLEATRSRDTHFPLYQVIVRKKTSQEIAYDYADSEDELYCEYRVTEASEMDRLDRAAAFEFFRELGYEHWLKEEIDESENQPSID